LITTTTLFKPLTTSEYNKQTTFTTSEKPSLAFYTNSSINLFSSSTQSSSQTNSFLLSLLLILFILIICVAMISIWIFFQHNYRKRNIRNQNFNIMSNIDTWNTFASPTLSSDKQKNTILVSNTIV
jgi:hypothetical protein